MLFNNFIKCCIGIVMSDHKVNQEQKAAIEAVNFIYMGLAKVVVTLTVMPIVLVVVMWDYFPHWQLIVWAGGSLLVTLYRVALANSYHKQSPSIAVATRWGWYYALSALVSGLLWGAANILFFVSDSVSLQLFLFTSTLGLVVGSTINNSHWLPAYYGFSVPATAGIVVALLLQEQAANGGLAILVFVYLIVAIYMAKNINTTVKENIRLKYANIELIDELKDKTAIAEQASQDQVRFLAAASHDLRQPVHALSLFHDALKPELHGRKGGMVLEQANSALKGLEDLLMSLLDISRLDAGVEKVEIRDINIRGLVDGLSIEFLPQALEKKLELRVHCKDIWVATDMVLLGNLLRNLISNAIRYTSCGGILLAVRAQGKRLRIEVWDTGVGIDNSKMDEVFKEFCQLHNPERDRNKGLGLGLSICHRIAVLLGAEITLRSTVNAGSVFKVVLPTGAIEKKDEAFFSTQIQDSKLLEHLDILVIDDEQQVRQAMQVVMESWGCDVWLAETGQDAYDLVSERGTPDIVVTDFRLRDGENGIEVANHLRQLLSDELPVLLVTGDTEPKRLLEANESGFNVLHKPVKAAELRNALEQLIPF